MEHSLEKEGVCERKRERCDRNLSNFVWKGRNKKMKMVKDDDNGSWMNDPFVFSVASSVGNLFSFELNQRLTNTRLSIFDLTHFLSFLILI